MAVFPRNFPALFLRFLSELLYGLFLLGAGTSIGFLMIFVSEPISVSQLLSSRLSETTTLYDKTGSVPLYEVHGEEDRVVVWHNDIPDVMRHAMVAAEDRSFYRHYGVDPLSILRAVRVNFEAGRAEQGASTITQQLARARFLSREKTLSRKVREAVLAIKIEREFSKDDILDLYLNTVPFGSNAYGVERASESFFGKPARDLSIDEAAFLAALPRATTHYSPYGNHRSELRSRERVIIDRMEEDGWITPYEAERARSENTFLKLKPPSSPIRAPHFVFAVLDELEQQYGREFLETGGFSVRTTIDLDMQERAERAVSAGADRNIRYGANNAALVAVEVGTGDVVAMVGSRDYFDETIDGQVNVTMRPRQPGSAFKPFAYARAFEEGYQPETLVYDVPVNFGPDGGGGDYIPKDYDGKYRGELPMKEALPQSLNIPAVETLAVAGVSDVIGLAKRLGISTLGEDRAYGLAIVLGGAEVLPVDMASAFSVFASEGVRRERRIILSITSADGSIRETFPVRESRVLGTETARRINTVLSDNALRAPIFGAKSPLAFPKGQVAAKTGTTQNFRDAWTVGYTASLSVAVWTGNNDNTPMHFGSDGVFVAAPIWRDFMEQSFARYPVSSFAPYKPVPTDIRALASRFGKFLEADRDGEAGSKKDHEKSKRKKKKK